MGSGILTHEHSFTPRGASRKRAKLQPAQPLETYIAALASAGIGVHLALRFLFRTGAFSFQIPLIVTLALGGAPLLAKLFARLVAAEFSSDLLAGISIVTAVFLGEYLVGAIVVLMLSGGTALERFATHRASSALDALARRMPEVAHRKTDSGMTDVALEDIQIGDVLLVFPHEICPVDGIVAEGHGVMDESYLTGEPFMISKTPGAQVLSGAINQETALTIQTEKLPADSRYARIMKVMEQLEQKRPTMRRLGDRLGAWYTPAALGLAALGWLASGDPRRFLAVIVVATPCPLLIAIPVAIIGAISLSARQGIILRNATALEQIPTCRTLIFDKTGTLTYGLPSLTEIIPASGFDRDQTLELAAGLELYSKHPLAGAILTAAREGGLPLTPASQISEKPGTGLSGTVNGHDVHITGRTKVEAANLPLPPLGSGLECLVFIDGQYAAAFRFHDAPRAESKKVVGHFKPRHRVNKILLVSGDRESEVRYLADAVGISEVYSGKSPEEKVEIVAEETRRSKTLFLGDGINDAPALQTATVGVAVGHHNDITTEAADAVIMSGSLEKLDMLIHISQRMRTIALQSAIGGMALSILCMWAAAAGYLPPVEGAVAQEVIDLVAVLNAVRVTLPFGRMTDF